MSAAKPMHPTTRELIYIRQNHGSLALTPRQSRRHLKKLNRYYLAGGSG